VLSINNLASGTLLSPGQVLKIPQTANRFPGNRALHSHPDTYTVGSNESIYEIACYYGDVDPLVIASVNNISAPYGLQPGTKLQIP
jgi:LysM repeat protein